MTWRREDLAVVDLVGRIFDPFFVSDAFPMDPGMVGATVDSPFDAQAVAAA
jgi:hypothetical protein